MRAIAMTAGVLALITGGVAVFVSTNSAGTAALLTSGLVLAILGLLGHRIQAIEGAGLKFQLQEEAAARYVAAEEAEEAGEPEIAHQLRRDADRLMSLARSIAFKYEQLRTADHSSSDRTRQLENLIYQAGEMSHLVSDASEVEYLFDTGNDGNRVSALAMMQRNPSWANIARIQDAIEQPRSAFEQYHALRAAETLSVRRPDDVKSSSLQRTVQESLFGGKLGAFDSDRCRVAQRILTMLAEDGEKAGT